MLQNLVWIFWFSLAVCRGAATSGCEFEDTLQAGYDMVGAGFSSTRADCFEFCDERSGCKAATFNELYSLCWPHKELVTEARMIDFGHVLYIKNCNDTDTDIECTDNNDYCSYWASVGECHFNPAYMFVNCKHSCQQCADSGTHGTASNIEQEEYYTPDKYQYKYIHPCGLSSKQIGSIVFNFMGNNDAHILLAERQGDVTHGIREIVIGGWANTQSVIRKELQGTAVANSTRKYVVSAVKFTTFEISWKLKIGTARIITVKDVTEHVPLMTWTDVNPIDVSVIGISTGWGSDGFWQFQVCTENVALMKPCNQSSTSHRGGAHLAVDGKQDSDYSQKSCTHTSYNQHPYWIVDLLEDYSILGVYVVNRQDCCEQRLQGLTVSVASVENAFRTLASDNTVSSSYNFVFTPSEIGRFVRINIPGPGYLTLCEVEVYGEPVESCIFLVTLVHDDKFNYYYTQLPARLCTTDGVTAKEISNIAKHKPAYQSSVSGTMKAKFAVDGERTNDVAGGSCFKTNDDQDPFWMVDLESVYEIYYILVINRGDCCGKQLESIGLYTGVNLSTLSQRNATTEEPEQYNYTMPGNKVLGRYVRIEGPSKKSLSLCEVEVYGNPVSTLHPDISSPSNIVTTTPISTVTRSTENVKTRTSRLTSTKASPPGTTTGNFPTHQPSSTKRPKCTDCSNGCCDVSKVDASSNLHTHASIALIVSSVACGVVAIVTVLGFLYFCLYRRRRSTTASGRTGTKYCCTFCMRVQDDQPSPQVSVAQSSRYQTDLLPVRAVNAVEMEMPPPYSGLAAAAAEPNMSNEAYDCKF